MSYRQKGPIKPGRTKARERRHNLVELRAHDVDEELLSAVPLASSQRLDEVEDVLSTLVDFDFGQEREAA